MKTNMTSTAKRLFLLIMSIYLGLLAFASQAIVIRHDKPDRDYQDYATNLAPYLAHLDSCTATVIGDYWLLTAAHCVNPSEQYPVKITHLQSDYPVSKIIRHPDFAAMGESDIALLQLRWPMTNGKAALLNESQDELGKQITIAGKGATGTGLSGDAAQDKILRAATNTISVVDGNWFSYDFSTPDQATELEGVSGNGDSGGPAFIFREGVTYLVGVSCCQESEVQGAYGAMEHYSRVSTHIPWLQEQLNATPQRDAIEHPVLLALRTQQTSKALALLNTDTSWKTSPVVVEELLIHAFIDTNLDIIKAVFKHAPQWINGELQGLPLLDYALKQGNGTVMNYLIDAGVDINHQGFRNQHYLSRLMWQYFQGDVLSVAKKMLAAGLDINQQDERGDAALHMAGYNGDINRVKFLIEQGADINLADKQGNTLLMDAKRRGQNDIVEYLLANGAKSV